MAVNIIRTTWSGGPGGEGLTQFAVGGSSSTAEAACMAVRGFWNNLAGMLPEEYTLQVEPVMESYNETNGVLQGEATGFPSPAPVPGINTASWAAPVGCRIDWLTIGIRNGRRVRGRTFIVPIAASHFTPEGALNQTSATNLEGYALDLIGDLTLAGNPLVVWSRPSEKWPVGAITDVNGARVPTKPAVLTGRRD